MLNTEFPQKQNYFRHKFIQINFKVNIVISKNAAKTYVKKYTEIACELLKEA